MIKGRDVFDKLNKKVDPTLVEVLVQLAEEQNVLKKEMVDVAKMVDQMADILGNFTVVAENMKKEMVKLRKRYGDQGVVVDAEEIKH